jgi:hypothetical protein
MALPSDGQPWNNPKVRVGDNPGVGPSITTRVFVRRYASNPSYAKHRTEVVK